MISITIFTKLQCSVEQFITLLVVKLGDGLPQPPQSGVDLFNYFI